LFERAVDLLPSNEGTRHQLLCELGLTVRQQGDLDAAEEIFTEAAASAADAEDRCCELRARIELAGCRLYRAPDELPKLLEFVFDAIRVLEPSGDDRTLGRAWLLVGAIHGRFQCLNNEWMEAANRAARHYRAAGFSPAWCVGDAAQALYYGPEPVESALQKCAALLREHADDRAVEPNVFPTIGNLYALQGNFDDARACIRRAAALWNELGQEAAAEDALAPLGAVEVLSGEMESAESELRLACQSVERRGETAVLATRAAQLADVLHMQGKHDDARVWAQTARDMTSDLDLHAQSLWRSVTAKLEARTGRFDVADALSGEAVTLLEPTDALNDKGNALLDRAEVLRFSGREDAAIASARLARDLFFRKGNAVSAKRAETFRLTTVA